MLEATSSGVSVYEQHRNAILAYDQGEDARAEALIQGLLRIAPNDPELWLRLGNLYARSARADRAAEAYERALLLSPDDARLWLNLALVRQRQAMSAWMEASTRLQTDDPVRTQLAERLSRLQAALEIPLLVPEVNAGIGLDGRR